jgi:dihydroorotase
MAAINGGVTLFAAMPNDPVPPDNPATYARKRDLAQSSLCPVILFGAVTPASEPWGDIPYKVYLDSRPSSVAITRWNDVAEALARYRGCRIFFHAEDPELLHDEGAGPRWKTRPPEAEIAAVEKVLELTAKLGLDTHICHVSTRGAVELIESFNRAGTRRVSCEATPHHLFFGFRDGGIGTAQGFWVPESQAYLLDCNPPIRSEQDREFLVEALKDGLIDMIASDHAPHTLADKLNGAPGMPHLDTLGAFAGWLVHGCGFTPSRVAAVLSSAPARKLTEDLELPHGILKAGSAASFTVLDLAVSTVIDKYGLRGRGPLGTLCGWSPFMGAELPARVLKTVVLGRTYSFDHRV